MALSVDRTFVQVITSLADATESAGFNPTSAAGEKAQINEIDANGRVKLIKEIDTNNDGTFDSSITLEDVHPAADDISDTADRAIRADRWEIHNDSDQTEDFQWKIKNVSGGTISAIVVEGVVLA